MCIFTSPFLQQQHTIKKRKLTFFFCMINFNQTKKQTKKMNLAQLHMYIICIAIGLMWFHFIIL